MIEQSGGGRPLIRGLALVNDLAVARKLFGEAKVSSLNGRLLPSQRAEIGPGFEASRWYDERIQLELVKALADGLTDEQQFAVGAAIAQYNITTVQRFLARLAGPRVLLKRASAIWSYWRDTGSMHLVHASNADAVVVVRDHPLLVEPEYARFFAGASAYMVHATGAPNVRLRANIEPPSTVSFDVRWGAPPTEPESGFVELLPALHWCDQQR